MELDNVTQVLDHSLKFKSKDNHIIIPSQYILYALAVKEFALGLKEHLDEFDRYKNGKSANQIGEEIKNKTYSSAGLGLDEYSETIFLEAIVNEEYNFKPKSIINGNVGSYNVRGTSDFFSSVILKIIDVPDASSAMLGKLIYYLTKNPDLYKYLETRFIENIPYIIEDSVTKYFARKVFSYLYQFDNLAKIKEFISKNGDESFSSIKKEDKSLTSIFKTSASLLSEEDLKSGGKPRFFSDPLFIQDGEFYYFSTEWTDGTDSRLDLESLKSILEQTYPTFLISKREGHYYFEESSQKGKLLNVPQIDFSIEKMLSDILKAGLIYKEPLVTRFVSSLLTKPFIILTGLSGSGKTKLAQAFVQWICQDKSQYRIVPVGPDWTNREPLLGYPNSLNHEEYLKPESGVIELILQAIKAPSLPHFLILDEMNLSHVERYFADFLSVMESKEKISLHSDKEKLKSDVPAELEWPTNLFLIGTVNIDETTYMFSPKVLDRVNVIEFRIGELEMREFLVDSKEIKTINGEGSNMAVSFIELSRDKSVNESDILKEELIKFFKELQKVGAEFGYRTAHEVQILFSQIAKVNSNYADSGNEKIDIAIMQKLLPKLHGSRRKLDKVLIALGNLCFEGDVQKEFFENSADLDFSTAKFPLSLEKITRMYKSLVQNGFASYAEA